MLPDPFELGNEDDELQRLARFGACLCGHPEPDHESGGPRSCSTGLHPACGCNGFRPDPRYAARGNAA